MGISTGPKRLERQEEHRRKGKLRHVCSPAGAMGEPRAHLWATRQHS